MFESFDRTTSIIATTSDWATYDIVLKNGEFGIEVLSSTNVMIKAGDGINTWSALPYIAISDVTINTATQSALDAKLPLTGGTLSGLLVLSGDPTNVLGAVTKQYVDAINSSLVTSLAGKLSTAGGTLTGFLNLNADPTSALHAATKQYVDAGDATSIKKSGDTMSGALVLAADPANNMEAATKQYVDSGAYQTIVGGSSTYSGKVVKLNANGFLDTSIVPFLSSYIGTINLTTSYALTATYTVGNFFAVFTTGTIDASWYTKINGAPTSCGAGQFLIFNLNGKWDLVGDASGSTTVAAKLDKAGGTMTGALILAADPTVSLGAATKQYTDLKLPLTGGTLTGALTLAANPTTNLQPATKQYVDTANALAALKSNNLSDLSSSSTALTNLGGTTTGKALFTIASASAARTTLGSTTVGDALYTAASASAARTTVGAAASGANTDITSVVLANTGLRVNDSDASNTLSIVPSSNLTVNRTLSIATGDADRTLDISAGSVTITAAGASLVSGTSASAQRTTLGVTIGTNVQAWDADLDAIAALAGTSGLLKKTAANTWSLDTSTYLTPATGVSSITFGTTGLTPSTATNGAITVAGTLAVGNGGTGVTSYAVGDILYASGASALSKLADVATGSALISGGVGVAPAWGKVGLSTHVSGTLSATNGGTGQTTYAVGDLLYADTTSSVNKLADVATGNALISGGVGVAPAWGKVGLTTHVTGSLPLANGGTAGTDAASARTNLGLGTIATQAASSVTITGGSITGITDLAVADGGTGASTAAAARTNLGLGTSSILDAGTSANNVVQLDGTGKLPAVDGSQLTGISTAAAGRLLRAPQVLTSGTSYTTPAGCNSIYVECVGGGGYGGSVTNNGTAGPRAGGGGGAGSYCAKLFSVSPSTAYSYAIGAGGIASTTTNGNPTTFTVGGTTITAGRGLNGNTPPYSGFGLPGAGGTASNGDINATGNPGSMGAVDATQGGGGPGGGSFFGGGGLPAGSGTVGNNGANGGGGSGACHINSGNVNGGNGGAGIIRVWEYA